jgi:plastocyanin
MKRKTFLVSLAGAGAIALTGLFAQEAVLAHRIDQKDRSFSTKEITIRRGEKIEFCNADDVTHNVFSRSAANTFNIKTQTPGSSSVVEFKDEGVTEVRCAIHPGMKLIVTVKN